MELGCGPDPVLSFVRTVAETGSTNADLLSLARSGVAEACWLRAERQTAGRGRLGRIWVSPPGNLYASTLVRLRAGNPPAATLALVAGIAVDDSVGAHVRLQDSTAASSRHCRCGECDRSVQETGKVGEGAAVRLKWPNDLLLGGEKVAGILLERAGDDVVVGLGVNLAHHPDLPDRRTTSLRHHGVDVQPAVLLDTLVEAFARWLSRWRTQGLAPVRSRWLERAHPPGTALAARLPDGSAIDGLFDGLDADGALILRLAGGERRVIHAADVFLL